EPMTETRIDTDVVVEAGLLQPRVELLDVLHAHAGVLIAPMAEDRTLHAVGHFERSGPVVRRRGAGRREPGVADRRGEIALSREVEHERPAHAEPDRADLPVGIGTTVQPIDRRTKVDERPLLVEL